MIGDLEMIVHQNLTEFSRGRLVTGDFDIRPIGPYLRVSSGEVLRHTTHGLHQFSCKKLLFLMSFLHHRPQDIIKTFSWNKKPCECTKYAAALQLKRYFFLTQITRKLRCRYDLNEISLNRNSFLIKYSVYKEGLNVSLVFIFEPFKCLHVL